MENWEILAAASGAVAVLMVAAETTAGAASVIGPIVMSVLLLRVSGVTLLEKDMPKRRPGHEEYVRQTSAFFPRPPRD